MSADFKIEGLDQVESGFKEIIAQLPSEIKNIMTNLLLRAIRKVKRYTPVKTGLLRRNWNVGEIKVSSNEVKGEIFNNTKYALPVEQGHLKRGGKGFVQGRFMLRRTMDEMNKEMPKYTENEIKNFIKKHIS